MKTRVISIKWSWHIEYQALGTQANSIWIIDEN